MARGVLSVIGHGLIFAAVTWMCWNLRSHRMEGGDTALLLSPAMDSFLRDKSWTFFFREPLAFLMPQLVGRAVDFTWPREDILALPSCVAGGLYALLLVRLRFPPLFSLVILANATSFLFLGHLENYAFAYVALVATTLAGWRAARTGTALWPVTALWALAVAFHQAAAFMLPGALALLRGPKTRRDIEVSLLIIIGLCAGIVLFTLADALDLGNVLVYGTTGTLREYITPFTEAQADWVEEHSQMGAWMRYTMFSPGHWRDAAMFQIWLCPLGLVSLALLAWQRRDAGDWFLLLAGGGMLAWSFVWHPHMGWNDWDLWSLMAAPLNTSAALILSGVRGREQGECSSEAAPSG